MTADQVKQSQDQLDVQGELIDYTAKGTKIAFVGKDDMEGTEVFKLRLTDKEGKEKTLFFDAENYYLLREVEKMKADGKEIEATVNFSNYQKLPEGIVVPMTVDSEMGPVSMKSIEVNPTVDESIFKPSN
jgi:outer membrane lipoprotein-sorting protein